MKTMSAPLLNNDNKIGVEVILIANPKSQQVAIAALISGPFKFKGFKILQSIHENYGGDDLWVAEPSYRGKNGKFYSQFWCDDKELWNKIKDMMLLKYNEIINESARKIIK